MNDRAAVKIGRFRPEWIEDLITFYQGRIARQFVLHFNITDFVIDLNTRVDKGRGAYIRKGEVVAIAEYPQTMSEYLAQFLFSVLDCRAIYSYSLAGGLVPQDAPQMRGETSRAARHEEQGRAAQLVREAWKAVKPTLQQVPGQRPDSGQGDMPNGMIETFKLLSYMLRQKYYVRSNPSPQDPESPIAVILEYAEKLTPYQLGEGQGDREQLQALEVIQRWALDPLIRQTNNIIILLTNNIGQIPGSVYAEGSGCRAIRVPLPTEPEREAFILYKMRKARARLVHLNPLEFGETEEERAHQLARATQGMRLTDIDNVSRRVIIEYRKRNLDNPAFIRGSEVMSRDDVQHAKAEVIQAQSADLLEIVPPVRGFTEIGGLEKLKLYLSKRTKLMRSSKSSPIIPSGLLLAGPPGTGKTIIAEALATESGFNLVKMRNIQDKWIGSSERNLELVLNLLKDLHPVIVFIDEIDQALVRRDTGQSGDSGVGARMFARILEEMSNPENRGSILWVAATNRADILDEALLRRFDRVVPLLTPDVAESCRIFVTVLSMIVKQSGGSIEVAYGGDLAQSGRRDKNGRPDPTAEDIEKFRPVAEKTVELGLTGAGIETVVRRAIESVYEEMAEQDTTPSSHGQHEIPQITSCHLLDAIADFKPNHNRLAYDHQSLLAIRACNFRSVIPTLPVTDVYRHIQNEDGQIDPIRLEEEIVKIEYGLKSRRGI